MINGPLILPLAWRIFDPPLIKYSGTREVGPLGPSLTPSSLRTFFAGAGSESSSTDTGACATTVAPKESLRVLPSHPRPGPLTAKLNADVI